MTPEELDKAYKRLYQHCAEVNGPTFDRRTISHGWLQAFRRLAVPMYECGMITFDEYNRMGGREQC